MFFVCLFFSKDGRAFWPWARHLGCCSPTRTVVVVVEASFLRDSTVELSCRRQNFLPTWEISFLDVVGGVGRAWRWAQHFVF